MAGNAPALTQPRWAGQALHGETVLLWAEQGFGDIIQFCCYVPMVAEAGANVVLVAPKALHRLLSTLDGVAVLLSEDDDRLPAFDYHCPLMSLPFVFGTKLDAIPNSLSYLRADPDDWSEFLANMPGLKIGLVWAGKCRTEQPHAAGVRARHVRAAGDPVQ